MLAAAWLAPPSWSAGRQMWKGRDMIRVLAAVALTLLGTIPSLAHEYGKKGITVAHPWARATPAGAKVGGAYLEIKAAKGVADRLVAARSAVAGAVELHSHVHEGGVMKMRKVDAIAVPKGKSVVLAPSGFHVMLMDLKAPLKEGDLLKLTLVFEKAGEIEVDASVEPVGALGPHGFDHQPGHEPSKGGAKAGAKPSQSGGHKH